MLAAVYRGDRAEVDRLVAEGATLTLCEAAALGDAPRVSALARAEPAAVGRRSPDGWPALHLAAHFGHGDAVDALLKARDRTALAIAQAKGHTPAARRLRGEMP